MNKPLLFILFFLCSCVASCCTDVPENTIAPESVAMSKRIAASEVTIIDGVDASQFLGTWYEIARLNHSYERGLDNVTTHYEQNKDGSLSVTNKGYNRLGEEWNTTEGKAIFVEAANADTTYLGKLNISFPNFSNSAYNIIALDKVYYNYMMVSGGSKETLWILSRTPELTYPIKQHLVSQARGLGFATDELIYVNQNPDIPNYEAGQHVIKK